jgi:hemerythrin superfamily protein
MANTTHTTTGKSTAATAEPVDAISLLESDHRTVKALFKKFEAAKDATAQRDLAKQIGHELTVHATIEEARFYPAVKPIKGVDDMVLESLEEHRQIKELIAELTGLPPSDETFEPRMKVLIEDVEHHVEEEETDMFPKVRKALSKKELDDLGQALQEQKKAVAAKS